MTDSEVIDAILHIIRDRERYAVAFRKEATFRIEAYTDRIRQERECELAVLALPDVTKGVASFTRRWLRRYPGAPQEVKDTPACRGHSHAEDDPARALDHFLKRRSAPTCAARRPAAGFRASKSTTWTTHGDELNGQGGQSAVKE